MTLGTNKMRRTEFTIHLGNGVGGIILRGKQHSRDGSLQFSSERELSRLAARWPGKRLVVIWNQLPGVKRVTRFTDRKTAIRRIWTAVRELPVLNEVSMVDGSEKGNKTDRIVALLESPTGASLRAIMNLTGWQSHSVRGFISGQVAKRMGYQIQSFKRDGERIYRIHS